MARKPRGETAIANLFRGILNQYFSALRITSLCTIAPIAAPRTIHAQLYPVSSLLPMTSKAVAPIIAPAPILPKSSSETPCAASASGERSWSCFAGCMISSVSRTILRLTGGGSKFLPALLLRRGSLSPPENVEAPGQTRPRPHRTVSKPSYCGYLNDLSGYGGCGGTGRGSSLISCSSSFKAASSCASPPA
jgi:hypothetical protein